MALSVPEQHQLKIARATLKMHDVGAAILGGMTKPQARAFLRKHLSRERYRQELQRLEGTLDHADEIE